MDVRQEINPARLRAFAQQGVSFAFPTQMLYANPAERREARQVACPKSLDC